MTDLGLDYARSVTIAPLVGITEQDNGAPRGKLADGRLKLTWALRLAPFACGGPVTMGVPSGPFGSTKLLFHPPPADLRGIHVCGVVWLCCCQYDEPSPAAAVERRDRVCCSATRAMAASPPMGSAGLAADAAGGRADPRAAPTARLVTASLGARPTTAHIECSETEQCS